MLRATLVLFRDQATLTKDRVNLTRAQSRKTFVAAVAEQHHVTIEDGALLALEQACRTTATVRRARPEEPDPVEDEPARDDTGTGSASAPPPPLLAPLLDAIRALLHTYVVFPSTAHAVALTLWIACSYVTPAFDVAPYVHLTSPEKRSGKTRVLELLERLVWRPWRVVQPSAATIFRKVHATHPTLSLRKGGGLVRRAGRRAGRGEGQIPALSEH